jgi:cold shock CspA family protein
MATAQSNGSIQAKGYGSIQPQGSGKDVFVHIFAVEHAGLSTLNLAHSLNSLRLAPICATIRFKSWFSQESCLQLLQSQIR